MAQIAGRVPSRLSSIQPRTRFVRQVYITYSNLFYFLLKIVFQQIDIEVANDSGGGTMFRMFGVTEVRIRICTPLRYTLLIATRI